MTPSSFTSSGKFPGCPNVLVNPCRFPHLTSLLQCKRALTIAHHHHVSTIQLPWLNVKTIKNWAFPHICPPFWQTADFQSILSTQQNFHVYILQNMWDIFSAFVVGNLAFIWKIRRPSPAFASPVQSKLKPGAVSCCRPLEWLVFRDLAAASSLCHMQFLWSLFFCLWTRELCFQLCL